MYKKIIKIIVLIELIFLVLLGAIYFYPPSYVVGVWFRGNNFSIPFLETIQGAQRFWQLKKIIKEMKGKCYALKNDPLGYTLWKTPRGQHWFPANNQRMVSILLAQQEIGIYGYNKETSIKSGDIVLDCGAHVGVFITEALRLGAKKVIAIEPAPGNVECLKRNFKKEIEIKKVIICPKGIMDKEGQIPFYTDPKDSACGSFVFKVPKMTKVYYAPVTTIDIIVKELKLTQVDFIKMDIKGAEIKAFYGAANTIKVFKPKLAISTEEDAKPPIKIIKTVFSLQPNYKLSYGTIRLTNQVILPNELFFN